MGFCNDSSGAATFQAPCPDVYRGKYRDVDFPEEDLGKKYAEDVKEICQKTQAQGRTICAFIGESLQSCGGQIILPPNYLRNVYKHVRAAGGVCIADEVQVGFGRVGSHWWAFELQGPDIIPDIVTLGKPMGNGHPVAAVVTTPEIAKSFKMGGVEYFNTYGGNPVSCAVAISVMDVLEKENLRQHAAEMGEYFLKAAEKLKKKHDIIGDIRGIGLFIGIELVTDRSTREPATATADHVLTRMKENQILISTDGPDVNVIKLKPPMVFSKEDALRVIEVLDTILDEVKDLHLSLPEAKKIKENCNIKK